MATFPRDPADLLVRAITAQRDGRLSAAIADYQTFLAMAPNHLQALNNLGTAFKAAGRLSEAIDAYRQAVTVDPADAQAACHLATALHADGQMMAAFATYLVANRLRPGHRDTLTGLALIADYRCHFPYAASRFQRALQQDPQHLLARLGLARCLAAMKQTDEALRLIDSLLATAPQVARHWYWAGVICRLAGDGEQAVSHWRQALALDPGAADVALALAVALSELGQFEAVIQVCQDWLARDPAQGSAALILAAAQRTLGRPAAPMSRASANSGAAAGWINEALTVSALPSDEETARSRRHFERCLDWADAYGGPIHDPERVLTKTTFAFAYQGQNDRPLMARLAQTLLRLSPDLAWTAPHCGGTAD